MTTETLVRWSVDALVASSLLMLAVLLVRGQVRRAFGAQVAYALWALPALRLVLPPIPDSWREAAATPVTRATETVVTLVADTTAAVAPLPVADPAVHEATFALPSLGTILALGWALGALGFLVWHCINHLRFRHAILTDAEPLDERDGVQIVASEAASGPLAFGVVKRYVAFPLDFADRWDADEQALALDHELGHHARGDLVANWVALAVLSLHWFNPLAWRAFRLFRADQELANDARVLAGRSRTDRHIYACAIVKAAHGGAVSAACHLHTIEDLKGRLKLLTTSRASRKRVLAGIGSVAALVAAGLGLTASGTQAAVRATTTVTDTVTDKVGDAVGMRIPAISMDATRAADAVLDEHREALATAQALAIGDAQGRAAQRAQEAADQAERDVPRVSSGTCGNAPPPDAMTIRGHDGARRTITICDDRIARATPLVTNGTCGDRAPANVTVIHGMADGRRTILICNDRISRMTNGAGRMTIGPDGAMIAPGVIVSPSGAVAMPGLAVSSSGAIAMPGLAVSSTGAIDAPGLSVSSTGGVIAEGLQISSDGAVVSDGAPRARMSATLGRLRAERARLAATTGIPREARGDALAAIDRGIESIQDRLGDN